MVANVFGNVFARTEVSVEKTELPFGTLKISHRSLELAVEQMCGEVLD
jgi:hypothetical protein